MDAPANSRKPKYLVSACLAGIPCTYNSKHNLCTHIKGLISTGEAIPVCPEILGGLGIPREPSEITCGGGECVLKKTAKAITVSGRDVSKNYISGSKKALRIAKKLNIKEAILKSNSPACGFGTIYDGTFRKKLTKGNGVLAALLKSNGFKIYTEKSFKANT